VQKLFSVLLSLALILLAVPAQASPWTTSLIAPPPNDDISLGSAGAISPLKKGDKAPFDGVLLDSVATAKLMVNQQQSEAQCQIEIEKEVSIAEAKLQLDLANLKAENQSLQKEIKVRIDLKNEHIKFLETEAAKNVQKANNGKWWLVGGVAIGIALTIGGAFIIREIRADQPIVINNGI
jgi:hypothetical protein